MDSCILQKGISKKFKSMTPIWTIMIPTTVDRDELYDILVAELVAQMAEQRLELNKDVEIVSIRDNKEISVG
ncbi:hypothetical protein QU896_29300, partial [Citrobacter freundii]|uniref:hypothetical protein n=1 Tax=Citrobacter freundii TaxID=546 RepID=UPI0038C0D6E5